MSVLRSTPRPVTGARHFEPPEHNREHLVEREVTGECPTPTLKTCFYCKRSVCPECAGKDMYWQGVYICVVCAPVQGESKNLVWTFGGWEHAQMRAMRPADGGGAHDPARGVG